MWASHPLPGVATACRAPPAGHTSPPHTLCTGCQRMWRCVEGLALLIVPAQAGAHVSMWHASVPPGPPRGGRGVLQAARSQIICDGRKCSGCTTGGGKCRTERHGRPAIQVQPTAHAMLFRSSHCFSRQINTAGTRCKASSQTPKHATWWPAVHHAWGACPQPAHGGLAVRVLTPMRRSHAKAKDQQDHCRAPAPVATC